MTRGVDSTEAGLHEHVSIGSDGIGLSARFQIAGSRVPLPLQLAIGIR